MGIKSGKDQRLNTSGFGSPGGLASVISGDQARDRQRTGAIFQAEAAQRQAGIAEEARQSAFLRQKEAFRLKSVGEQADVRARRTEYDGRRKQIDTAFRAGKIDAKTRDDALKREEKRYPEVASPWFSEISKEEDPVWTSPDGKTQIPLTPEGQKAYDLYQKGALLRQKDQDKVQKEQDKVRDKDIEARVDAEVKDQRTAEIDGSRAVTTEKQKYEYKKKRMAELRDPNFSPEAQPGAVQKFLDGFTGGLASKGMNILDGMTATRGDGLDTRNLPGGMTAPMGGGQIQNLPFIPGRDEGRLQNLPGDPNDRTVPQPMKTGKQAEVDISGGFPQAEARGQGSNPGWVFRNETTGQEIYPPGKGPKPEQPNQPQNQMAPWSREWVKDLATKAGVKEKPRPGSKVKEGGFAYIDRLFDEMEEANNTVSNYQLGSPQNKTATAQIVKNFEAIERRVNEWQGLPKLKRYNEAKKKLPSKSQLVKMISDKKVDKRTRDLILDEYEKSKNAKLSLDERLANIDKMENWLSELDNGVMMAKAKK